MLLIWGSHADADTWLVGESVLGQLPKLFDRNFAIGYLLPVVVLVTVSFGFITEFDLSASLLPLLTTDNALANTTLIVLGSWLLAILLMAINRSLFRLMEGYGRFNPARLFAGREKRRYRNLLAKKNALEKAYWESDSQSKSQEIQTQLDDINR